MRAFCQVVGVIGLFLSSLPNACDAQQPSSAFELDKKVEQMQIAGRKLQKENADLKVKNILLQRENERLKQESAHLQRSQREAIAMTNTSQQNQHNLLGELSALRKDFAELKKMQEFTALRVEIAELRKLLNVLLQRKPVARDPRDPFAQEPPKTVAPRTAPSTAPRTKPPTTGKDPFGAPSSNSPR
jgi:hypothetical protein